MLLLLLLAPHALAQQPAQAQEAGAAAPAPAPAQGPVAAEEAQQEAALLAFKASLDNGDEKLTNWIQGTDYCAWMGISCTQHWVDRV